MASLYQDETPAPRARPLRTAAIVAVLAFLVGALVMGWAFTRWEPARRLVAAEAPLTTAARPTTVMAPATVAPSALQPNPLPPTTLPATTLPAIGPEVDLRIAQLEERIARIDLRAAAAAGNAGRAEGLLIAFAARRAIDRGTGLGYVEGQLRERFAASQPRAVAVVIAAAQTPATIASLKQQLDRIAPDLVRAPKTDSWWTATQRTLSTLVVIRREDRPSPEPDERIARARLMLDGGQADGALAEIARLPQQPLAADWMNAARRFVEAHRALDIIEAAAIMPPPTAITPSP